MKRVFIVDDDLALRKSLSRLLRANDFITEEFNSAANYLKRDLYDGIGCILLDVNMPGMSGPELQMRLIESKNNLPIIFLTGYGSISMSVEAMKRGAIDFLTKPVDESDLLKSINQAHEYHRKLKQSLLERESIQSRLETLTHREIEVMHILITGALNKTIADRLDISIKTVKVHRANLLQKMGVRSAAELVHLCHLAGIEPDSPTPG